VERKRSVKIALKAMKQLIVNADDFGLTENVNRGIVEAHTNGIVTSTSLLSNGEAFHAAVALSKQTPRLGIGVHLNLSEGAPVSPRVTIPTLVDARGSLHLSPIPLWRAIVAGRVNLREVEIETRAQVSRILNAGIAPTHLDGHMHVHVLPRISEMVIRIARQFGIQGMRSPAEPLTSVLQNLARRHANWASVAKSSVIALAVSRLACRLKERLDAAGLVHPAHFRGMAVAGALNAQTLRATLSALPEGVSELMCHPGYFDADVVRTGGRLQDHREVELQALTAAEIRSLIQDEEIHLITYGDLVAAQPRH